MEKVLERNYIRLSDGREIELEYFLVSKEKRDERIQTYGIGIQKCLGQSPEGDTEEADLWLKREVVESVTESKEKAVDWIGRLAKYQVTPMGLVEVLDDFITQEGV